MHDRTFILCATVLLRALASRFSDALDNEVALSIAQRTSEDSDSPLPSTGNTDRVIKVSSYGKSDVLNLLEAPFSRLRSVTGLYIPISPHFNGKSCTSRDFRILHPIGKGSSSIVYLAEHLSNNGQQVVIKEYSKIYSLTNLEEIRMEEIVLKLNHPNLLKGICTYMENGIVKIVTEYPASRTITSAMKNGMLNNLEAQRGFVQQMAEVLKYLHGLDLIHNDIKPDNILIDDNHEITLIDFGYATRKMFESSNICGSPLYMSFTKLQGYSFDNGEDWYGLGTILYEIISGTHPFGDPKTLLALKKAMNAPVAPLLDADANDFVSMLRHFDPMALGAASRTTQSSSTLPLSRLLRRRNEELLDAKGCYSLLFPKYDGNICTHTDFEYIKPISHSLKNNIHTVVYLAKHSATGKNVVIKAVSQVASRSILMEEIALHRLDHPNIPKGVCTFLDKNREMVHLVMEFITEKTFKQWIGTPEASDPKFLQKVARQLVDVLAYLHDQRILHNDIKPPNILVSDSGLVQLIDYGLAMTSRSKGNTNVVGSPVYESPEKLAGCYKNGADWYALAVTLLEVKNGVHPFENIKSLEGLKLTVVYGLPKSKDPVFNDFIQKIGHVDPDLRWSHGNGKIDDIRNHPFLKNSYDPAESKTPADTVPEIVALETISLTDGAVATLDDVQ